MSYAIRITEVGASSFVIAFAEEGKARLAQDAVTASGDARWTAEYLGRCNHLPVHFTAANFKNSGQVNPPTLRQQAIDHYERALPHRIAYDVVGLVRVDDATGECSCQVLGGFRPQEQGK